MTVAQGINKTIAYKKQSGLGSAASGAGSTYLRRVTAALNVTKDSYENNEIVAHQQGTHEHLGQGTVQEQVHARGDEHGHRGQQHEVDDHFAASFPDL